MVQLEDKVVIVTGAAGALGRAVTQRFADAGARLVLVDHERGKVAAAHEELVAAERAIPVGADLTHEAAVARVVGVAREVTGRIDGLVNVVGGFAMSPVHETSVDDWDRMHDLNARTVFLASRAVLPFMVKQKRGAIVSVAARAALQGGAKLGAYSASKAAVVRLTEAMSADTKAVGVNVNCVLPGTIDTPANRESMPKADHDKWVPPEAIADVILFLASDMARGVHGAAVPVFGLS